MIGAEKGDARRLRFIRKMEDSTYEAHGDDVGSGMTLVGTWRGCDFDAGNVAGSMIYLLHSLLVYSFPV